MERTLGIIETRKRLPRLPEDLAGRQEALCVTRRGRPVLAVLPWDFYEAVLETLEVLSDPDLRAALEAGLRAEMEGRTVPWVGFRRELRGGLEG